MTVNAKSDVRPSRWTGRVLRGKWRIDGRISRGGVGTVYAATHQNNGSRVAIKVLNPEFSRDEDVRSRFLQEGYAANQVNHPGVVKIIDDDVTEEGFAFLVMELLEGELLEARRVRKGGMLPLREVYEVADQLLDVLEAAHDKGIIHRDIKPENLFLTSEGRLKVLDFGFAQMKRGLRKERTVTGFLLGTPGFMSPEQAVGARAQVDTRTDIWAVGATLFNLLSGRPVHEGETAVAMLAAAASVPARSLSSVTSGLPHLLVQIVDRAVAFDKDDRWPTARSMRAALRKIPGRPGEGLLLAEHRGIQDVSLFVEDDDEMADERPSANPEFLIEDAPTVAQAALDLSAFEPSDSAATMLMNAKDMTRVAPLAATLPAPPMALVAAPNAALAPNAPLAPNAAFAPAAPRAELDVDEAAWIASRERRTRKLVVVALVAVGFVALVAGLFALDSAP